MVRRPPFTAGPSPKTSCHRLVYISLCLTDSLSVSLNPLSQLAVCRPLSESLPVFDSMSLSFRISSLTFLLLLGICDFNSLFLSALALSSSLLLPHSFIHSFIISCHLNFAQSWTSAVQLCSLVPLLLHLGEARFPVGPTVQTSLCHQSAPSGTHTVIPEVFTEPLPQTQPIPLTHLSFAFYLWAVCTSHSESTYEYKLGSY